MTLIERLPGTKFIDPHHKLNNFVLRKWGIWDVKIVLIEVRFFKFQEVAVGARIGKNNSHTTGSRLGGYDTLSFWLTSIITAS